MGVQPKTKDMKLRALFLMAIFAIASPAFATTIDTDDDKKASKWMVDKSHSQVNFSIKHFFTPVNGSFGDFDVELNFDPADLDGSSISVSIDVGSVDTGNERRNGHLRTPDFFDSETYPKMTFESSSIESTGENMFVAKGTMTIKDVTKDFELPFTLLGVMDLPERMQKDGVTKVAGFEAKTSLMRNDYGVGTGNFAATATIGGEVTINIAIEAKQ